MLSSDGSSSQLGPCLEALHRNPSMSQVKQAQARIKVGRHAGLTQLPGLPGMWD